MCGIAGFTGAPDRSTLEAMVHVLTHRGPDDAGFWQNPLASLGMRRLSIIDVSTGQQPAFNESKEIVAVMNGEIYNHVELRSELEKRGHKFRSDHSDTEVIPHLYEEYGVEFFGRLNGMFAIALWDQSARRLVLARDRYGIKPLFYTSAGESMIFGSEIKALLKHPSVVPRPDPTAIYHYLSFKNVPSPGTAFEQIEQLRAGEYLICQDGGILRDRWWCPGSVENRSITEDEAALRIRELLEDSIRLQMRSDVPFGAYLSGGIDSSAVVGIMSRLAPNPIRTFTLAYEDDFGGKNADRAAAERISRLYGTDHHVHVMSHRDVSGTIEQVIEAFDEPFSGTVSTFFLTGLIAEHVKVALSGDGADELFGSYLAHRLAGPLHYFPKFHARWDDLRADEKKLLEPYSGERDYLAEISARGDEAACRMGLYLWDDAAKDRLLSSSMRERVRGSSTESLVRACYADCPYSDPLNRALDLDFQTLLPDQVLPFVDRLSMAHSVEVRPPFLDHRLVEFVKTLPGAMKIKDGRVKHILKESVRDLLPPDLLDRPKEGFVLPVHEWIRTSLREYARDLLSPASLRKHGFFDEIFVEKLLNEHLNGVRNHAGRIWNLMMFQVWWNRFWG